MTQHASILTGQFTHDLPSELEGRASSTSGALRAARHLGTAVHDEAVDAFTDAMATGFRFVAALVVVATIIVARGQTGRR